MSVTLCETIVTWSNFETKLANRGEGVTCSGWIGGWVGDCVMSNGLGEESRDEAEAGELDVLDRGV